MLWSPLTWRKRAEEVPVDQEKYIQTKVEELDDPYALTSTSVGSIMTVEAAAVLASKVAMVVWALARRGRHRQERSGLSCR